MKILALALLAMCSATAQISIGISIGAPPPVVYEVEPVRPGPNFVWISGYWYPVGRHYKWHQGYWTRPPYRRAFWVMPRYDGGRYFTGYWDGDHGRRKHDHHWDHNRRRRDFDRDNDQGHDGH